MERVLVITASYLTVLCICTVANVLIATVTILVVFYRSEARKKIKKRRRFSREEGVIELPAIRGTVIVSSVKTLSAGEAIVTLTALGYSREMLLPAVSTSTHEILSPSSSEAPHTAVTPTTGNAAASMLEGVDGAPVQPVAQHRDPVNVHMDVLRVNPLSRSQTVFACPNESSAARETTSEAAVLPAAPSHASTLSPPPPLHSCEDHPRIQTATLTPHDVSLLRRPRCVVWLGVSHLNALTPLRLRMDTARSELHLVASPPSLEFPPHQPPLLYFLRLLLSCRGRHGGKRNTSFRDEEVGYRAAGREDGDDRDAIPLTTFRSDDVPGGEEHRVANGFVVINRTQVLALEEERRLYGSAEYLPRDVASALVVAESENEKGDSRAFL